MWLYRERLNYYEKLRRSFYEIMRDALELRLMKISLIDSFYNYLKNNVDYLRTCASFKLTTYRAEIRILDRETAIFAWGMG